MDNTNSYIESVETINSARRRLFTYDLIPHIVFSHGYITANLACENDTMRPEKGKGAIIIPPHNPLYLKSGTIFREGTICRNIYCIGSPIFVPFNGFVEVDDGCPYYENMSDSHDMRTFSRKRKLLLEMDVEIYVRDVLLYKKNGDRYVSIKKESLYNSNIII